MNIIAAPTGLLFIQCTTSISICISITCYSSRCQRRSPALACCRRRPPQVASSGFPCLQVSFSVPRFRSASTSIALRCEISRAIFTAISSSSSQRSSVNFLRSADGSLVSILSSPILSFGNCYAIIKNARRLCNPATGLTKEQIVAASSSVKNFNKHTIVQEIAVDK